MTRKSTGKARVLFVQKFSSLGGSQRSLVYHLELLDRERFSPSVLVSNTGWLTEQLDRLNIPWSLGTFGRWGNVKSLPGNVALVFRLLRHIKNNRIDLVHANEHWIGPPCVLAAKLAGIPAICQFRTGLKDLTARRIRKYLYRYFDRVLPVADVLRRQLVRHLSKPEHIITVRDGVEPTEITPMAHTDRGKTILINIGAIYHVKGQAIILDRVLDWLKADENRFIHFVGGTREDPDYVEDMKQVVANNGLANQVLFLGVRSDTESLLNDADALVAYSTVEGIPRVVMEAMLMSRPVIVSNSAGMDEVVIDGLVGRIVDFENPTNELQQALEDLADNPSKWLAMGEAGRREALAKYSTSAMSRQIQDVYDRLLDTEGHGTSGGPDR